MPRQKLTLSIDVDLLKKVKDSKINISSFLEIRLREYIALVNNITVGEKIERAYGGYQIVSPVENLNKHPFL